MWRVNLGAGPPYFFSPQNTTDPYTRCQMLSLPGMSIVMTKVLTPGNPAIHLLPPCICGTALAHRQVHHNMRGRDAL